MIPMFKWLCVTVNRTMPFRSITNIHSHKTFSTFIQVILQLTLSACSTTPLLIDHYISLLRPSGLAFLITFVNTLRFNIDCE